MSGTSGWLLVKNFFRSKDPQCFHEIIQICAADEPKIGRNIQCIKKQLSWFYRSTCYLTSLTDLILSKEVEIQWNSWEYHLVLINLVQSFLLQNSKIIISYYFCRINFPRLGNMRLKVSSFHSWGSWFSRINEIYILFILARLYSVLLQRGPTFQWIHGLLFYHRIQPAVNLAGDMSSHLTLKINL
jgi:hypothetical protein